MSAIGPALAATAPALVHWRWVEHDEGIVELVIDVADAAVNTLGEAVLAELEQAIAWLEAHVPRGLIISSAKDSGFIAGANVREFLAVADADAARLLIEQVHRLFDRIEFAPFASVAMLRGFCLGGGLELALACRYRVAVDEAGTRIGFPEVMLGIHPGFGGSWRSIDTIGALRALPLMLTARNLSGEQALRAGLVDELVPARHRYRAARRLLRERPSPAHASRWQRLASHAVVRHLATPLLKRQVARRARPAHYPAPYALLDLWRDKGGQRNAMLAGEADSVASLVTGTVARNLTRLFLLQETLRESAGDASRDFAHVHVIGAGTMGGDIAAWCASRGLRVTLQDRDAEAVAGAMGRAARFFERRIRDPQRRRGSRDRLLPDPDGIGVADADVIIEAIVERLDAKQALFAQIEAQARPDALLATNTSSIALEDIAAALKEPARLVGLHFFNPVARMQLVEVIHGAGTDPQAHARAAAFACAIDKLPLAVRSAPGFLVNRTLIPYMLEAVVLAEEGVSLEVIDASARDFGFPLGPVELADMVGLDVCLAVGSTAQDKLGLALPALLREKVRRGHLGKKTDRGFYHYRKGARQRAWRERVLPARPDAEVTERLVLRYLNEAMACLDEQVVANADLADAGLVYGTGFAPFRGGPFRYIREQGVRQLRERLFEFQRRYGDRFRPADGWVGADDLPD